MERKMDPNTSGLVPERGALLMRATSEIESARLLLIEMTSEVRGMADQIFGPIPMPDEATIGNKANAPPYSHMEAMQFQIEELHTAIRKLGEEFNRIEPLV